MKKIYLLATALAALVSCTSDDFTGEKEVIDGAKEAAISFNMNTPATTRAEDKTGAEAAEDLNNQFIIWGEKNENGDGKVATAANLVFKNYQVNYVTNTAYTTTSNTMNWEYVGYTHSNTASTDDYKTNIYPSLSDAQTIKYWDYGASSYTFTAVSANKDDLKTGKVKISKVQDNVANDYAKGYEIELKSGASPDNLFVADRNNITDKASHDRTQVNKYGGNVTMRFRNFMSKIRFGIYETIPGYKVKVTRTYYNSTNSETNFGVDGKFLTAGDNTKFTVTYENHSNKALVNIKSGTTPNSQSYFVTEPADEVTSGTPKPGITVPILTANYIGTTSTTATFNRTETVADPASVKTGAYTTILPFSTNDENIKLKIDFQLISEDTGETINISGKTAEVPAKYCQWKSNYAYTYLFKITDDDLYPITFDAVEVVDENGEAEYITTVTDPSITTYANASSVTTDNEYKKGSNIYVVVNDGVELTTTETPNAKLYVATIEDGAAQGITEETVKNAIATNSDGYGIGVVLTSGTDVSSYFTYSEGTYTSATGTADGTTTYYPDADYSVKDANGKKLVVNNATESLTAFTGIPAADTPDGIAIANIKGAKFTPASAGYYVFEYTDDSSNKHYKVIKVVE